MAPEVYKDEIFDRSVDAFSFGLVLFEVLYNILSVVFSILAHALLCTCLFFFFLCVNSDKVGQVIFELVTLNSI